MKGTLFSLNKHPEQHRFVWDEVKSSVAIFVRLKSHTSNICFWFNPIALCSPMACFVMLRCSKITFCCSRHYSKIHIKPKDAFKWNRTNSKHLYNLISRYSSGYNTTLINPPTLIFAELKISKNKIVVWRLTWSLTGCIGFMTVLQGW